MNFNTLLINEKKPVCKKITATYQLDNGVLGGPVESEFSYKIENSTKVNINIEQLGIRKIVITTEKEVSTGILFSLCQSIEKLLMLFEGRFVPLEYMCFSDSDEFTDDNLIEAGTWYKDKRLGCYESSDFSMYNCNKIISYNEVINEKLLKDWIELDKELDLASNVIFYALSKNFATVDIKCIFSIELAEAFIDLIKERKGLFSSLKPGNRETTLKMCLDMLITKYGNLIFEEEIRSKKDFLQMFVRSRNRMMHIKRHQGDNYLDGAESILYTIKFFNRYRIIIFETLGIDEGFYLDNLKLSIAKWNEWEEVLEKFLNRID